MYVSEGWRLVGEGIMLLRKVGLYWLLYFLDVVQRVNESLWWSMVKDICVKTLDHGVCQLY